VRPDVCEIEDVDALLLPELLGLGGSHGLDFQGPGGEVALFDGVVEILLGMVGGLAGGFFLGDKLDALLGLHVELGIEPVTGLVDDLDSVADIPMHETISIWDTTVTHEDHDLVDRFGVLRKIVPEYGRVICRGQVGDRVSLLGVDEVRELGRVSKEEDGGVPSFPRRCGT
jgi:hypothetical protein